MKKVILVFFLFSFSFASCIYHEEKKRTYGGLEIFTDERLQSFIHVVYTCDATHFYNEVSKEGSAKDVRYTYYILHHQLLSEGTVKSKMYRWFSEDDKYLFFPQEDSLLRVLQRSGPALKSLRLFNEISQYKKFMLRSFDRGLYQLDLPMKDSLYHFKGHELESEGFYSIQEFQRTGFFGSTEKNNDTLYTVKMDQAFQAPGKIVLPPQRHFFRFSIHDNPLFIGLTNDHSDSLLVHNFDVSQQRVGDCIASLDLSPLPGDWRSFSAELAVKAGRPQIVCMNAVKDTVYNTHILKDLYSYGDSLRHFVFNEKEFFKRLEKSN